MAGGGFGTISGAEIQVGETACSTSRSRKSCFTYLSINLRFSGEYLRCLALIGIDPGFKFISIGSISAGVDVDRRKETTSLNSFNRDLNFLHHHVIYHC